MFYKKIYHLKLRCNENNDKDKDTIGEKESDC